MRSQYIASVLLLLAGVAEAGYQCSNYTITQSSQIDFLFIIDTSGSMDSAIAGVKKGLKKFVGSLATTKADARFAVVSYGGIPRIRLPFTVKSADFDTAMGALGEGGGNEAAFEVMRSALPPYPADFLTPACSSKYGSNNAAICNLSWRSGAQKVMIVVTDEDSDLPVNPALRMPNQEAESLAQKYYNNGAPFEALYNVGFTPKVFKAITTSYKQYYRNAGNLQLETSYSLEVAATAQVLIDNNVIVNFVMNELTGDDSLKNYAAISRYAGDSNSIAFLQFGNPLLASQSADYQSFSRSQTLTNLRNAGLGNSLQARMLAADKQIRLHRILPFSQQNENVINSFYDQLVTSSVSAVQNCTYFDDVVPISSSVSPVSSSVSQSISRSNSISRSQSTSPSALPLTSSVAPVIRSSSVAGEIRSSSVAAAITSSSIAPIVRSSSVAPAAPSSSVGEIRSSSVAPVIQSSSIAGEISSSSIAAALTSSSVAPAIASSSPLTSSSVAPAIASSSIAGESLSSSIAAVVESSPVAPVFLSTASSDAPAFSSSAVLSSSFAPLTSSIVVTSSVAPETSSVVPEVTILASSSVISSISSAAIATTTTEVQVTTIATTTTEVEATTATTTTETEVEVTTTAATTDVTTTTEEATATTETTTETEVEVTTTTTEVPVTTTTEAEVTPTSDVETTTETAEPTSTLAEATSTVVESSPTPTDDGGMTYYDFEEEDPSELPEDPEILEAETIEQFRSLPRVFIPLNPTVNLPGSPVPAPGPIASPASNVVIVTPEEIVNGEQATEPDSGASGATIGGGVASFMFVGGLAGILFYANKRRDSNVARFLFGEATETIADNPLYEQQTLARENPLFESANRALDSNSLLPNVQKKLRPISMGAHDLLSSVMETMNRAYNGETPLERADEEI